MRRGRFEVLFALYSLACTTLSCRIALGIDDKHYEKAKPAETTSSTDGAGGEASTSTSPMTPTGAGGSIPCPDGYATCSSDPTQTCATSLLTDSSNCGRCGRVCDGGTLGLPTCTIGQCPVSAVAPSGQFVYALVELDGRLYWGSDAPPQINSVDRLGAGPATVLTTKTDSPFGIAVRPPYVYWTTFFDGTIKRVGVAGGDPIDLITAQDTADQLYLDDNYIYFSARWNPGSIRRMPISGAAAPDILADNAYKSDQVSTDATYVYWTQVSSPGNMDGGVWRASKLGDGSDRTPVVSADNPVQRFVVDDDFIYWSPGTPPVLMRVSKQSFHQTPLAVLPATPGTMVGDADAIYYADADGNVSRVSKADGSREVLADGQENLGIVFVDDTRVFWIANDEIRSTVK